MFRCFFLCRNSVRLVIRKVQFAPTNPGPAPKSDTTKQFMLSDKPLHLEVSLDKEVCCVSDRFPLQSVAISPLFL